MEHGYKKSWAALLVVALWGQSAGWTQTANRAESQAKSTPAKSIYPVEPSRTGPAWYVDVAGEAGIRVMDVNGGAKSKRFIIESTGSGVAILDYDNDGWPDIFLLNGTTAEPAQSGQLGPTSHLFHNNHDGTFTDVTAHAGLGGTGWAQGVCAGDYDNDGYDDLYVTAYGKNKLFHNHGDGTFHEVAEQAGVAGNGDAWGTGCAFVDYDRDGKLDLMVSNYVHFRAADVPAPGEASYCIWKGVPTFCGPRGLAGSTNILYHNAGNGKFEDVTKASGIANTTGHYCFSVSTLDYDNDGWPDIYVACDSTPSILYHNNHNGTFSDVAVDAGVAYDENGREQASMGTTVGDFDGDGKLDIFKTNFSDDTPTLYRNNGDGSFTDVTFHSGVGVNSQYLGWGTMFMDVDNHGWLDLLEVNGHVYPEVDHGNMGSSYAEPRVLFRNQGNGKFQDISKDSGPGITTPAPGRGMAVGDLWNDGRLEVVINNMNDWSMLLVNVAGNKHHWLGVRLVGTQSNRDGIGARVTVRGEGRSWVDEVRSGSSYDSNNDLRLHFGLGEQDKVAGIDVRWPNGQTETFCETAVDRMVSLREGAGCKKP